LRGRIATAVIDANDFVGLKSVERSLNFVEQRFDILRFIAYGDDDGNRRRKTEIGRIGFHVSR
jgi:hypothetical protein